MPPVPTTITTQVVSASTLLNKVVHWDGSPRDIELVLNAAFDAKDYLDCILNLPARNIDPLLYINSLDKIIDSLQADSELRRRCLRALRKTCGIYGILPTSHIVPFSLTKNEGQRPFGSGDFSEVWKLTDEKNRAFAVKQLWVYQRDPIEKINKRFAKQVIVSKRMRHPNILSIEGVAPGPFEFCMVSRWMENGSALYYVRRYTGANRLELLIGVTCGLDYLHRNGVVHGNLKSSNILVDSNGVPCLSGFGLCSVTTDMESWNASTPHNGCTLRYCAPELFDLGKRAKNLRRKRTSKSDIYSLSMVIVELVTGQMPFPDYQDHKIPVLTLRGKRPQKPNSFDAPGISPGVWKIAKQCWHKQEKERPDTAVVLRCLETLLHSGACTHNECTCLPWEKVDLGLEQAGAIPLKTSLAGPGAKATKDTLTNAAGAIEVERRAPRWVSAFSNQDSVAMSEPIAQSQNPWEADLTDFLRAYKTWDQDLHRETALLLAERLSEALEKVDLHAQQRKRYLRYLRKLCAAFCVLPPLFVLPPTSLERETTLFARGGFGDVFKGTFNGSPVVIKTLRVEPQVDLNKLHKLLINEVVGWKWLRHENILPFLGVSLEPTLFSIIPERMEHGSIMDFIKLKPNFNRLRLLVGAVSGLKHLHDHGIIHGDLKGANILVDSTCCARLADFGLAVAVDESVTGSTLNHASRGTPRWMAPELVDHEVFGFTGQYLKQLPSVSTDIYAMGMTTLEILTGRPPFDEYHSVWAVMYHVVQGARPERPPSGFTDQLWEMLAVSWVEERAGEPQSRLPVPAMLDRLKESVEQWERSIVPLTPNQRKGNIPSADSSIIPCAESDGKDKTIKQRHSAPGIANTFKEFLRRDLDVQET